MHSNQKEAKYHVAIDMDDTLCSYISEVMAKARQLYKTHKFKLPAYGRYNHWFNEAFEDVEHRKEFLSHIYNEEFYSKLPPAFCRHSNVTVKRVSEIAWNLYRSVSIVTARRDALGSKAEDVTRQWLKDNEFHRADEVEIIVLGPNDNKVKVLKRNTVIVDDSVAVAHDVHNTDHKMILVSNVWNDAYQRSANCRIAQSRKLPEALELSAQ